jgi:hypothetical protein
LGDISKHRDAATEGDRGRSKDDVPDGPVWDIWEATESTIEQKSFREDHRRSPVGQALNKQIKTARKSLKVFIRLQAETK